MGLRPSWSLGRKRPRCAIAVDGDPEPRSEARSRKASEASSEVLARPAAAGEDTGTERPLTEEAVRSGALDRDLRGIFCRGLPHDKTNAAAGLRIPAVLITGSGRHDHLLVVTITGNSRPTKAC